MVLAKQVTLDYVADARGTSIDNLAALMASVPIPLDGVAVMGCQLISDTVTKSANLVTREIVLGFAPSTDATVDGVTFDEYGGIESVSVGTNGGTYGAAPVVTITDTPTGSPAIFYSTLLVNGCAVVSGGSLYTSPTVQFVGGLVPPQIDPNTGFFPESCLQAIVVSSSGSKYSSNAKISFQGTLATDGVYPTAVPTFDAYGHLVAATITNAGQGILSPLECFVWDPGPAGTGEGGGTGAVLNCTLGVGTPAQGTATVMGGVITAISVTEPGGPYVMPPTVVVTDVAGSGAVLVAQMGVNTIDVVNPGSGYPSSVTFSIEPVIRVQSPIPAADLFRNLMTVPLQQAVLSPITASEPVLS